MIHPDTELRFINDVLGRGVFAVKPIPKGTIIWVLGDLDQRFTRAQVETMSPHYRAAVTKNSFVDADGVYILCWDLAQYVNHCCDPTDIAIGPGVELLTRDVAPGDQITTNYGLNNLEEALTCHCGALNCRGAVRKEDLLLHAAAWDAVGRATLPAAAFVPQPLRPFLPDPAGFDAMVRDPLKMPSLRGLFHEMAVKPGGAQR